jgi:NADH-quinone oxidoreductase subunit J
VEELGRALFQRWVYPFELTSVLLLAALAGAVALTRQAPRDGGEA